MPYPFQQTTKLSPGITINWLHPLSRGLIGMWLINEGAGSGIYDVTGFNSSFTLTNMDPRTDWVGGIFGNALDFNGTNNFLEGPFIGILASPTTAMSVVIWVNIDSFASQNYLISKGLSQTTFETYRLRLETSGAANFSIQNNGLNQFPAWQTANTVLTNEWNHFVFSLHEMTASESDVTGYLNGVSESLTFTANGYDGNFTTLDYSTNANATVRIGSGHQPTDPFLPTNGKISLAMKYNRGLNAEEAKWLFHEPFAMFNRQSTNWLWSAGVAPAGGTILPQIIPSYYRVSA